MDKRNYIIHVDLYIYLGPYLTVIILNSTSLIITKIRYGIKKQNTENKKGTKK
jgi:hypothetical protein